jgi:uncharacterized damage-inducible protein DinB
MPGTLQTFLIASTEKAARELIEAIEALPEERRSWSPTDRSRSALDQAAECAILNGATAETVILRRMPDSFDMAGFEQAKKEFARDWATLRAVLAANTAGFVEVLRSIPDEALNDTVVMPWGDMAMTEVMAYPFWNMTYHLGQVTYISLMAQEG